MIHSSSWDTLWCEHHQHLASDRDCCYTEDPANAPDNRKPIPVTVTINVNPREVDYGQFT